MSRRKAEITPDDLQKVISQLESEKVFSSPNKLFQAVAESEWGQSIGVTPVVIYLRVKDFNADPAKPGIIMKTGSNRGGSAPRVVAPKPETSTVIPAAVPPRRPPVAQAAQPKNAFFDFNELFEVFRKRGVEIEDARNIMVSDCHDTETNRRIVMAWWDLRERYNWPICGKVQPFKEKPNLDTHNQVVEVTEELADGTVVGKTVYPKEPVEEEVGDEVERDVVQQESWEQADNYSDTPQDETEWGNSELGEAFEPEVPMLTEGPYDGQDAVAEGDVEGEVTTAPEGLPVDPEAVLEEGVEEGFDWTVNEVEAPTVGLEVFRDHFNDIGEVLTDDH